MEPEDLILIKFSEVLGLRGMEKVKSKRDDFEEDALSILSQCIDLSTGVICSVLEVPVTA